MNILIYLLLLLFSLTVVDEIKDNNWPAWRGPHATGVASQGNPPLTWSETENIKWKVKIRGSGHSSPVIWGNQIFFQTAIKTDKHKTNEVKSASEERNRNRLTNIYKFDLICLDRNSGNMLWQQTTREEVPHQEYTPKNEFASYSPITDGTYVWASFGSRGVHCYDMAGNHKWSIDLGKMNVEEGEGSSPTLAAEALIVVMDQLGGSFIIALNKYTGETIWRRARDESTSWSTPLVVDVNERQQVITSATKRVRSYDVKTGDLIWECAGQTMNTIPSPVYGFGMVFCASGFQGHNLQAIKLGYTGDLTGTEAVRWEINKNTPYIPSTLLYGDKLYISEKNRAVISCYQAETGKVVFEKKKLKDLGEMYASPVGVKDRIYFIDCKGKAAVIKHAEKFEILTTNTLNDTFHASPAIAGNELFLKGDTYLYCIEEN